MAWWLIVYILTGTGWESGDNFDGWSAVKQESLQACQKSRDFANTVNINTSLVNTICFACEPRFEDGTSSNEICEGPCAPCEKDRDTLIPNKVD